MWALPWVELLGAIGIQVTGRLLSVSFLGLLCLTEHHKLGNLKQGLSLMTWRPEIQNQGISRTGFPTDHGEIRSPWGSWADSFITSSACFFFFFFNVCDTEV
jgi:hypothetical protein